MRPITVLGASGFIGSALVARLEATGVEHYAPGRDEDLRTKPLGHIIYCVGLTADFRSHPFEAVEAHACHLLRVLRDCDFRSLLYLSSTRLYRNHAAPAREEDAIQVCPSNRDDLYNISKIMGESLSLSCGKNTRVARLSNVYGDDFASENFLTSILRDAVMTGKVVLQTTLASERDYISVDDVVDLLIEISTRGRQRIYNLASGRNVSHRELTRVLNELTSCRIETIPAASTTISPLISIDRTKEEFGFKPAALLDDMGKLIDSYRKYYVGKST